jgi:hypothetical protein
VLGALFARYAMRCAAAMRRAPADDRVPLFGELPDAAVRGTAGGSLLPAATLSGARWQQAGTFAAPLLLAVVVALILYVSLLSRSSLRVATTWLAALQSMSWARASRSDMFNNVLLYMPLGFCLALLMEPRLGRAAALPIATLLGAALSLTLELLQARSSRACRATQTSRSMRAERLWARSPDRRGTRLAPASRRRTIRRAIRARSRRRSSHSGS